ESLSFPAGTLSILHPHERLLEAGAFHATLVLVAGEGLPAVPLQVPPSGLSLKENARVSRLVALALA
ncbi:MAG: deoxycytidine triphosphate deaminase, partial [Nitrospinota bacterium]